MRRGPENGAACSFQASLDSQRIGVTSKPQETRKGINPGEGVLDRVACGSLAISRVQMDLREAPRTHDKIVQERMRIGKRAIELQRLGVSKTVIAHRLGVSWNHVTTCMREAAGSVSTHCVYRALRKSTQNGVE